MAILCCDRGHYFDDIKYESCPICMQEVSLRAESMNEQETVARYEIGGMEHSDAVTIMDSSAIESVTELIVERNYDAVAQSEEGGLGLLAPQPLTVGWLVCTSGRLRGASFPLYVGKNLVGSEDRNDIAIKDSELCPFAHFFVVYDERTAEYHFAAGKGYATVNGSFVAGSVELKESDEITVGELSLVFVPYCNEKRGWSE